MLQARKIPENGPVAWFSGVLTAPEYDSKARSEHEKKTANDMRREPKWRKKAQKKRRLDFSNRRSFARLVEFLFCCAFPSSQGQAVVLCQEPVAELHGQHIHVVDNVLQIVILLVIGVQ